MHGYDDLIWTDKQLRLGSKRGRVVASIEPAGYRDLWRARLSNGYLTDMANLTRAKDAAKCLVLADLNSREKPSEAPPIRPFDRAATVTHAST